MPSEKVSQIQVFRERARRSLKDFVELTTIASRPFAKRFGECCDPWQVEYYYPIIPAVEYIMGLRPNYDGKRRFWRTLAKGSSKTSFIGTLCNGALQFARYPLHISACAADSKQSKLLRDAMLSEWKLNPWYLQKPEFEIFTWEARGPGGSLDILSSDAPSSHGKRSALFVCDEITHWASEDLWNFVAASLLKYDDTVCVVITNAGYEQTWQFDLLQKVKESPSWDVMEAPGILASWVSRDQIAEDRKLLAEHEALRLIDNIWVSNLTNRMFPPHLLEHIWDHDYEPIDLPSIEEILAEIEV